MKNDVDDNVLNRQTLRQLQRLMRKINFYVQAYKVVDQRILNFEHSLVEFQLKQHDLNRQRKDTHNKFIFHEVATVMILLDNDVFDRAIERDILIQSINDDFLRVLYWQSCYMILRYSLIFSYEEQSWMKLLSLLEHEDNNDLLARRVKSNDDIDHHESFETNESKSNNLDESDDKNSDVSCDKNDFKRVTQKEFYRYWMQINRFQLSFSSILQLQKICFIFISNFESLRRVWRHYRLLTSKSRIIFAIFSIILKSRDTCHIGPDLAQISCHDRYIWHISHM